LLHAISHPNIIDFHGVLFNPVNCSITRRKGFSYSVVVDRLQITLDECIKEWKIEREYQNQRSLSLNFLSALYRKTMKKQLSYRLGIALSIARAMEHLHSMNIVYRDLKPQNIGFDRYGDLKLFDFGFAKELKLKDRMEDGRYNLTGSIVSSHS
jgi:serine/threonine protein kinase